MCGIFAYVGSQTDAPQQVITGLKKLEYRGYDSWGVAYQTGNKLQVTKQIGKIGDATLRALDSTLAIGHTRWATHGGISVANAHPHLNPNQTLAVVHNGIVENYSELKQTLDEYPFKSETDTEVITALLDKNLKSNSLKKALILTTQTLKGLNGVVVAHAPTRQIAAIRNGSPLVIGKTEAGFYLASDTTALAGIAKQIVFLAEGELALLSQEYISLTNFEGQPIVINWQPLQLSAEAVNKGRFPHFMIKEISEQPAVLGKVLSDQAELLVFQQKIAGNKLILVGCGTAYHACLAASYYFAQLGGTWVQAFSASEFKLWRNMIDDSMHVLFVSQSGETIDIIEHAQWLHQHEQTFSALVNRIDSSLSRLASQTLSLGAGPEICVLATKSFTAQLATFLLLATPQPKAMQIKRQLQQLIEALPRVIGRTYCEQHLEPLVPVLQTNKNLFVIGKQDCYPLALEAALKIKESTYLHMEGFAAGELKHGVLALIETGTPVFVLVPDSVAAEEILASAQEAKARGAFLVGVGPVNKLDQQLFDLVLPTPALGLATGIIQSVIFQLIAYYTTVVLGNDPDKPRNLAKSVTVK